MSKFRSLVKFWLPTAAWLGLIFFLSSFPTGRASHLDWQDFAIKKTIHLLEYAVLFTLFYRGFKNSISFSKTKKNIGLLSFLAVILYASSDEFHQTFTQGREGTIRDIIIDGFGAILAWLVLWKYLPKAPEKLKNWAKNWQLI